MKVEQKIFSIILVSGLLLNFVAPVSSAQAQIDVSARSSARISSSLDGLTAADDLGPEELLEVLDTLGSTAELNTTASHDGVDLSAAHVRDELLIKFKPWAPEHLKAELLNQVAATDVNNYRNESYATRVTLRIESTKLRHEREIREPREPRVADQILDRNAQITKLANPLAVALQILMSSPIVEYAEPNYIAEAFTLPNDSYYSLQWNLPLIGLPSAWDETQGDKVTVAVIDSGVAYENWNRYRVASDLAQTRFVAGYDFVNRRSHANDDNGHGTHVAGTIAGSTNNGQGVASVAHRAAIMPIKVLDRSGIGTYANIADGVRFAADNGAHIINLSLGGPVASQVLKEAIVYAAQKNVLIIAASGNDGGGQVAYPAAYDEHVLAVGAVGFAKTKTAYSTYGTSLDLMAPGGDTAIDQNKDGYMDGILQQTLKQEFWGANTWQHSYYFYQGTSMAAPHVSGVAALVRSLGVESVSEIKKILLDSAEDLSTSGWDAQTGHGLVRADKAVELAMQVQNQESGIKNQEVGNPNSASSQDPSNTSNPSSPSEEEDNPPESEEPAQEEPRQEEPTNNEPPTEEEPNAEEPAGDLTMSLAIKTYNMFGRVDKSFAFWETAFLGASSVDDNGALSGVDIAVDIYDSSKKLVAKGSGQSNQEGELLLKLGNFAKGSYEAVVSAIKDGYSQVIEKVGFKFR